MRLTVCLPVQLVDKKFPKASQLFAQLAAEKMDAQTRSLFMDALAEVIATKSDKWSGSKDLEALVQQIVSKHEALTAHEKITGAENTDDADRYATLVESWKLLAITHAQLFTDETYQFVKAAKVVKTRLESIAPDRSRDDPDSNRENDPDSEQEQELALVMPLLRTLFAKHTTSWARAMVESVLVVATQKRLRFSAVHREEVDEWTTTIQGRRSAPAVARSAASDARRNIVTDQGSQATVKVGRVNHPLVNREF